MAWNRVVTSRIGLAYGARGSLSSVVSGSAAGPIGTIPVKKRTIRASIAKAKPRERAK